MAVLRNHKRFREDTRGDAVVEATILFPIMIMIFAALVLLAMYLPQRTILQEAAQYTAIALATENSDTYIAFDGQGRRTDKEIASSVYASTIDAMLGRNLHAQEKAYDIANYLAGNGMLKVPDAVSVDLEVTNYVIYQEIAVTLRQTIPLPVDLSFIGFPKELELVQEASAVVQNGDEFVRNIDIAKDMMQWLDNKLGVSESLRKSGSLDKIGQVVQFFGFGG